MNESEVLSILKSKGVILTGHFVYTGGRYHGAEYVAKELLIPDTEVTSRLCAALAEGFADLQIDTVLSPALGAIPLAHWTAHHLCRLTGRKAHAIHASKGQDGFDIHPLHLPHVRGKNVLLIEDVINRGGSASGVVDLIRRHEGKAVGVGAICNRGEATAEQIGGVPRLISLVRIDAQNYRKEDCPQCRAGVPINTNAGHGEKYLNDKK